MNSPAGDQADMMISKILIRKIEADIAAHPLAGGEFRRIAGLGPHFISLEPACGNQKPLFVLEIGEREHYVYYDTARPMDENASPPANTT